MLEDGALANGAFALRDAYSSIAKALPQVSYYAGTEKLKVFMAPVPGERFSETATVNGGPVTVAGEDNGQAIVIHPAPRHFLFVGYHSTVSLGDPAFEWPGMKSLRVEKVRWAGDEWASDGEAFYGVNQSDNTLEVVLDQPQAVRVSW